MAVAPVTPPVYPPNDSAAVCVPAPAFFDMFDPKAAPVDQAVPLYSSVHDETVEPPGAPPKAKPAFCVPVPAR